MFQAGSKADNTTREVESESLRHIKIKLTFLNKNLSFLLHKWKRMNIPDQSALITWRVMLSKGHLKVKFE